MNRNIDNRWIGPQHYRQRLEDIPSGPNDLEIIPPPLPPFNGQYVRELINFHNNRIEQPLINDILRRFPNQSLRTIMNNHPWLVNFLRPQQNYTVRLNLGGLPQGSNYYGNIPLDFEYEGALGEEEDERILDQSARGSGLKRNKKKIYKGRGLKVKDIKSLLKASYLNLADTPTDIGDYTILPHYSTDEVKVFISENEKQFVIVVRGTDKFNPKDLYTDARLAFERTDTARFTSAKKILDEIINTISRNPDTFGDFKIDVIGHSLGGKVAYEISRKNPASQEDTSLRDEINDVITLNSAGTFTDKKTKNPFNKWDIRSEFDFLHKIGAIPPEGNTILINPTEEEKIRRLEEKDEELARHIQNFNLAGVYRNVGSELIPENLKDLLYEHEIDRIDRLDQERLIGRPNRDDIDVARPAGSGLRKKKKNNKWIEHVLKYQKKYKVPYNIALKEAKKTY